MPSSYAHWRWLVCGLVLTSASVGCQRCGPAPTVVQSEPVAHLGAPAGTVSVLPPGEGSQTHPGVLDETLPAETQVTTGSDGNVDVVFVGNVVVHLGPSSQLLVRDATGGTQADVGAIVLKGSMRISAPAGAAPMQVQTPMGVAKIGGAELAVMDVTFDHGVQVATGKISLSQSTTAAPVTLGAGQAMTVQGLSAASPEVGGLSIGLQQARTFLPVAIARAGRHTRRRAPKSAWQPAERGQMVHKGDEVEVTQTDEAQVKLGDHMRVELADGAALVLEDSDGNPEQPTAKLNLSRGHAQMAIEPGVPMARQIIHVAHAPVVLSAPVHRAELEVQTDKETQSALYVRFGAAQVGNDIVPAGFDAQVVDGKLAAPPTQAFPDAIEATPAETTEIYYDRTPPPVAFVWTPKAQSANDADVIELARDQQFSAITAKERGAKGRFALDRVGEGETFWRVDAQQGALRMLRDGSQVCDDCRSTTELADTGESVEVSYQQLEPKVVLNWSKLSGVQSFHVRVAEKDKLDHPIFDERVRGNRVTVPEHLLGAGSYVWWVVPSDSPPSLPGSSQLNEFMLVQDTTVDDVVLSSPARHALVRTSSVKVAGRAAAHLHIAVNNKPVQLDERGRFVTRVPVHVGANRIVVAVKGRGHADQYYVRDVHRSP